MSLDSKNSPFVLFVITILLFTIGEVISIYMSVFVQAEKNDISVPIENNLKYYTTANFDQNSSINVKVGGGNNFIQYYAFDPQVLHIKEGQSVTWYSPTHGYGELHTVSFQLDPSLNFNDVLPFEVSNTTYFKLYQHYKIGQPQLIKTLNDTNFIVSLNKIVWSPAVVKSKNNNDIQYLNGSNIRYTLDGTERAINSGIILPLQSTSNESSNMTNKMSNKLQFPSLFVPVNTFTLTFTKPGTYNYFCTFHPWMTGKIIVEK